MQEEEQNARRGTECKKRNKLEEEEQIGRGTNHETKRAINLNKVCIVISVLGILLHQYKSDGRRLTFGISTKEAASSNSLIGLYFKKHYMSFYIS